MLNQEQAEAALKKFESKEFVKRRQTLCGKLPARLRETSRGLCGCNVRGKEISDWIDRHRVQFRRGKKYSRPCSRKWPCMLKLPGNK